MGPEEVSAASQFLTFAQLAKRYGCSTHVVGTGGKDANSPAVHDALKTFRPHFALNLRNNMIYDAATISIPTVVCPFLVVRAVSAGNSR